MYNIAQQYYAFSIRTKRRPTVRVTRLGRDETTPLCRNQLRATQTAQKRGESHQSGARCVGTLLI
jgi:hypothetical protein